MATDEEDSSWLLELCVVKTVLVLNKASVVWRFWEITKIGLRSLRSGNRYRYASGSVAIWDHCCRCGLRDQREPMPMRQMPRSCSG
jgi:hypothetical protein